MPTSSRAESQPSLWSQAYGHTKEGKPVNLYTLTNGRGMEVSITNYGSTVVALTVPDRNGDREDVVLGYDRLEDYESGQSFFGGTIGRYANRIAHGKFTIDGRRYVLPKNDGDNSLHGGIKGFHKRVWAAEGISGSSGQALRLTYLSEDEEEGFPGSLSVTVIFSVPDDHNDLRIDYTATTSGKDTILNLTNHSFFNLNGAGSGDILGHRLIVCSNQFTPIDAAQIPTGEFCGVENTPFDFARATAIGERICEDCEQLNFGRGYDHNWVLNRTGPGPLDFAAQAYDPISGRMLEVLTTEPGIQFYSGNFLNATIQGKRGKTYGYRCGFCLETQHFPDSPNHPHFPSTLLKVGECFRSTTVYRFSAA